jgi:hypothetical protein
MTNGANDDVHIGGEEVTANGCANHGGECAFLWSTSKRSTDKTPTLALCIIDASIQVYVSSRSITSLPPQLRESIQAWRDYLVENGIFLRRSQSEVGGIDPAPKKEPGTGPGLLSSEYFPA